MPRYLTVCALVALGPIALRGASAQVPIGPVGTQIGAGSPSSADYTYVGPLGKDSNLGAIPTAFAQTFRAPQESLDFFSLYFTNFINGGALNLSASVYQFDTDHLVGSALFTKALSGTDSYGDEELGVGTGGLALSPNEIYALVLSSVDGYPATPDGASILVGALGNDDYDNGQLYVSTATDAAALHTSGGFVEADVPDLAFSASFSAVAPVTTTPEPATLTLLITGIAALSVVAGCRRRRLLPVVDGRSGPERWC